MSNPRMGQTVVVHGTGLIGMGVIAACAHRGCRVVAVDLCSRRLKIAQEMGADILIDATNQDVEDQVKKSLLTVLILYLNVLVHQNTLI